MVSTTRHIERVKKKMMVKVEDQNCIMVDMSKVGMRLIMPVLLKKRDITVSLQINDQQMELNCRVCWIKKELNVYQQSEYQVGLFIPSPPRDYVLAVESLMHWL
jgi:hypothetical protein